MLIHLKKSAEQEMTLPVTFPCDEKYLSDMCRHLGIEITSTPNCYIDEVIYDLDMNNILSGMECNIDELNFLAKRVDSFDNNEKTTFYASTVATKAETMAELINLTFNTHCYSVVSNFSSLEQLGKDLYLNAKGGATREELRELGGKEYINKLISNNPNPTITSCGVVYQNENQPQLMYDGKHFPAYHWKESNATLRLTAKGENEYLYLPCAEIEIQKALMRLEVNDLSACEVDIETSDFCDRVLSIISDDAPLSLNFASLNNIAKAYKEMGSGNIEHFEKLVDYVNPRTVDEILALADSMHEFEIYDKIQSAESYGRYMICESGHFEYDSNLEDYIDFKRYGQDKMAYENGAFSNGGYIAYLGFNHKLENMLFKNLGIVIPQHKEHEILKLYMPLNITTYDVENGYGFHEKADEPQELQNSEVVDYLDEILQAIEENNLPEEKQRGIMKYYDDRDSVNAKVVNAVFSAEIVEGELMGVAVLILNEELNPQELEKIKEEITGQASDGWGEGFEQRGIDTDNGEIFVSFWNSDKAWFIKTAEEMGIEQKQIMGGISL